MSICTQMVPSTDGTFELTVTWQFPGGQLAAWTLPNIANITNEASKVASVSGAVAFNGNFSLDVGTNFGWAGLEARESRQREGRLQPA